jgi:tRNA(Arg) A34 adenosine deaminase TadA
MEQPRIELYCETCKKYYYGHSQDSSCSGCRASPTKVHTSSRATGKSGDVKKDSGPPKLSGKPDSAIKKSSVDAARPMSYDLNISCLHYICSKIRNSTDTFAFCVTRPHNKPLCCYAISDDKDFSAIRVLLQGCSNGSSDKRFDLSQSSVYRSNNFDLNELDKGMAKFCRVSLENILPVGYLAEPNVGAIAYALQKAGFRKLDSLKQRQALDVFKIDKLGARPAVNLQHTEQQDKSYRAVHRLYMMAAYALATLGDRTRDWRLRGKFIGALLVLSDGQVQSWGVNTNANNSTFHAELNAIESFIKGGNNPRDGRSYYIYTTLQPCCMCAGMIKHYFNDKVKVFYGQKDPGHGHMDSTILQGLEAPLEGGPGDPSSPNTPLKPIKFHIDPSKINVKQPAVRSVGDEKPLLEEDPLHQTYKVKDMKRFLEYCFDNRKLSVGGMVEFLHLATASYLMGRAGEEFQRKFEQYKDESKQSKNSAVHRVLNHLHPFLVARGVQGFQAESASDGL